MNILQFRHDPALLGSMRHMRTPSSQVAWDAILAAIYGLPMDEAQLAAFRQHTGRSEPRPGGYSEAIIITGRQSGKSQTASDIVTFEAATAPRDGSADGTYALLIAQDQRAALRTLFAYVSAPFSRVALLSQDVVSTTADTIVLKTGLVVGGYPCRPPAIRGLRARVVVVDELEFFRSSENIPTARDMLRAVRPCLATTGGKLIVLSSPGGQSGALWDLHRQHFGREDSNVLVIVASAPDLHPLLPASYLQRMEQDDPEGYRAEVLGEFLPGESDLFDPELVDSMTADRGDLPPQHGVTYYAGADVSGGKHDAAAVAIAHREGEKMIVDLTRTWKAPHNPVEVIAEASELYLKLYRCFEVVADRYAAQFQTATWQRNGVTSQPCEVDRSGLYLHMLPLAHGGLIELPNTPVLLRELRGLSRRRFGGRVKVDHRSASGCHDDTANACAAAIFAASQNRAAIVVAPSGGERVSIWLRPGEGLGALSDCSNSRNNRAG